MFKQDNLKRIVLAASILGISMVYIESVADNVALPAIQSEFNARLSDLQWVDQVYALCLVALLLVGGSLGDRFGRKRMFVVGIGSFVLASMLAGLTQNSPQLIGARALQGLSAALLVPGSLALITEHYDSSARGAAIGVWWAFSTGMLAVGLVVGGWLIQFVSWRAIFFVNIPLGLFALTLLARIPDDKPANAHASGDWLGALLATLGVGGIIFALIEHANYGWTSLPVLGAFALGVLSCVVFVRVEARAEHPLMPLSLFRSQNYSTANSLLLLIGGILTALFFFLPLFFIQVQGYSAGQASLGILPMALALFFISRWAGSLAARIGARPLLVVGSLTVGAGLLWLARQGIDGNYWSAFFPGILLAGVGLACTLTPLTSIGMTGIDARYAGVASGVLNASARVGNLLVVTVLVTITAAIFSQNLARNIGALNLAPSVANAVLEQSTRLAGAQPPQEADESTRAWINHAIDESFVTGFRASMLVGAGIMMASAIAAFLLIDRSPQDLAERSGQVSSTLESAM